MHKEPINDELKRNIKILQSQYSMLINEEIEWKIKLMRQKSFEHANKPGGLLAWQIKKREAKKMINQIKIGGNYIS